MSDPVAEQIRVKLEPGSVQHELVLSARKRVTLSEQRVLLMRQQLDATLAACTKAQLALHEEESECRRVAALAANSVLATTGFDEPQTVDGLELSIEASEDGEQVLVFSPKAGA